MSVDHIEQYRALTLEPTVSQVYESSRATTAARRGLKRGPRLIAFRRQRDSLNEVLAVNCLHIFRTTMSPQETHDVDESKPRDAARQSS
jgi:hypothetical protein